MSFNHIFNVQWTSYESCLWFMFCVKLLVASGTLGNMFYCNDENFCSLFKCFNGLCVLTLHERCNFLRLSEDLLQVSDLFSETPSFPFEYQLNQLKFKFKVSIRQNDHQTFLMINLQELKLVYVRSAHAVEIEFCASCPQHFTQLNIDRVWLILLNLSSSFLPESKLRPVSIYSQAQVRKFTCWYKFWRETQTAACKQIDTGLCIGPL